ncbi:MAG: DUF1080 domain-containing protein [Paludibacter sp.]|nr:DUF1080 domain-containing protein [Paludibacter sp.]
MNKNLVIILFIILIPVFGFSKNKQNKENCLKSSDWEYVIKDKSVNPTDVFKVENGIMNVTGISSGYFRTKKSYSKYVLTLDWRWTKKLGNSGVLIHIQPKDSIWPVCYQVQQKADAAGDIICMNGLWAKECTDSVKFTIAKKLPSNERPLGEWNSMKIICRKNLIKVYVNGVFQNKITKLTVNEGFIGFQNEGTPIEFKNICIK